MENVERNKFIIDVFTYLMRLTVQKSFSFPGGGLARRTVEGCMADLQKAYGNELSKERITDFIICQVYAITRFDKTYVRKWKVNHSFGKKAQERFLQSTGGRKYYEDKWLSSAGISRSNLYERFKERKNHPLYKFIYPQYEEATKKRMHNSEVGFYLCQISTLLWTPFSPSCQTCRHAGRCIEVIRKKFSELYRIRSEEYQK